MRQPDLIGRLRATAGIHPNINEACRQMMREAADELEATWLAVGAARKMPRWTPKGGGAGTLHTYQIEAAVVWDLDRALTALEQSMTGDTK